MSGPNTPSERSLRRVQARIIAWFEYHGRSYPWRQSRKPFEILIAEMMLRRTTATAVAKVYPILLHSYPSPESLAEAHPETLVAHVTPLGLQKTRSRHLREAARRIVEEWNGAIPSDFEALLALPGVGRYVAAAVRNFAFGKPEPLVDNNVIHLISRVFGMQFSGPDDERAWEFMLQLGKEEQNPRFYWGIIDLVSTVCKRRNPRCAVCPLASECTWIAQQG